MEEGRTRAQLEDLFDGADKTEIAHPNGWWETSTGAEFGKGIKEAVLAHDAALRAALEQAEKNVAYFREQFDLAEALLVAMMKARDALVQEGLKAGDQIAALQARIAELDQRWHRAATHDAGLEGHQ